MREKMRRRLAVVAIAVGVVLAVLSAGPWSWGLGCLLAVVLLVSGWQVLTDRRPPQARRARDH